MVITGGSALPKDDIDKMMREAEQYAEEDRKRREETETRNNVDTLAYSIEKFLGENDENIPAEVKTDVQTALDEVKKTLEGTDIDAIRTASEKLAQVSQKMGAAMYAQNQPGEEAPQGANADAGAGAAQEDEVVDAEIVDDENTKREGGAA